MYIECDELYQKIAWKLLKHDILFIESWEKGPGNKDTALTLIRKDITYTYLSID